ncbi:MAG: hypothetical protein JRI57_10840 [Deltaproteobacteria bacterium]|nr:hypothetical protein [Deltaproteobacteria bacterium]MBW1953450.1 hypothetical protein [Deltaproteobacteria bacterium]MBW1987504.1 hypothetical protein [Deltaproteobacteria bacterium]
MTRWKIGWVMLLFLACLVLMSGIAEARNPYLSKWNKNLTGWQPQGETWIDTSPEIAVNGTTVHALWFSRKSDNAETRVCYRRSVDGGQTFSPKIILYRVKPGNYLYYYKPSFKHLAVDGNSVHIAFSRYFPASGSRSWYFNLLYFRSTDNGATFEPVREVFQGTDGWYLNDNKIAAHSGKVTLGFSYYACDHSKNCVRLLNSDDGGATFKKKVVTNIDQFERSLQDLTRVGDRVYFLHYRITEPYNNGDFQAILGCASSTDGGKTFKKKQMTTKAVNGKFLSYVLHDKHYSPNIAVAGSNVYVVWTQNNTAYDSDDIALYCRRSNDQGLTWSAAKRLAISPIAGGKLNIGQETVAAKGNYVYVVFSLDNKRIFLKRSSNNGKNFHALKELTAPPGTICSDHGWWPLVQTDPSDESGKKVHVLWKGATYRYSANGGITFTKPCWLYPAWTGNVIKGLQMAIGKGKTVHYVMQAKFNTPKYGWGDEDIFYRVYNPIPPAPGANHALKLWSNSNTSRYDNMTVPHTWYINPKTKLTAELWVRPISGGVTTGTTSKIRPIFTKRDKLWPFAYALSTWNYQGVRQAAAMITTTKGHYWLHPSDKDVGRVPNYQWVHLAMTYNANVLVDNFKLYKNGELIASTTAEGKIKSSMAPLIVGYFGRWKLDELRIWNRALTEAEIKANMNKPLVGNEAGLQAYYNFDQTTKDLTGHGNNGVLMYREAYVPK